MELHNPKNKKKLIIWHNISSNNYIIEEIKGNSAKTGTVFEADTILEDKGEKKEINELENGKHST